MENRRNKRSNSNLFKFIVVFIVITFSVTLIISTPSLQVKILHSQNLESIINSEPFTNTFLYMLGEELPQLGSSNDKLQSPSLSRLALEAVTGIKKDNIMTLLENEMPGLNINNTEIYIAGKGSDYTNLPEESPPPDFNELLQNQSDNEDNLATSEEEKNNKNDEEARNPTVYIYHSHSWEGYLPLIDENVKPSDSSSVDNSENVVLVGAMLTKKLEKYGINTFHNTSNVAKALRKRGWNYQNSYSLSREYVTTAATQNPTLEYYIDIHRDSARKESTTATISGIKYARIYFVVGKEHQNYEENLAFAKIIHEGLERKYPGLSKGIYIKSRLEGNGIYNQDISKNALLVEVGGIDNTKKELESTVSAFAEVFKGVYEGVIEVNATR